MTTADSDPLDAPTAALAAAVLEIVRHVGQDPLPQPRVFALARTSALLGDSPALASLLGIEDASSDDQDALHLTPVDLEVGESRTVRSRVRDAGDPLSTLEQVRWPDLAAGGAITADLPPESWALRESDDEAVQPQHDAVRIVAAALTDGATWSAVHRGQQRLALGANLLPDITSALLETLTLEG